MKYIKSGKGYCLTEKLVCHTEIKLTKPIKTTFAWMTRDGKITLYPGFWWDGATGAIDTPDIMRASALHDCCCNWYNAGLLDKDQRKMADKMFKGQLKKTSMWSMRIKWIYQSVRKFFELKEWLHNK